MLKAKKSLGQHFLTSPSALEKIIDAAHIQKGETILEIGPGTGILTDALLKTGANIIAVEKDDRAFELLQTKYMNEIASGSLKLIHGDVLTESKENLGLKNGEYALVANIPYYITGAILESFLEYEPRPNRMVLLVQKEVADRITTNKDGKESILSVSVKAFGEPKMIAKVPKGAFNPPPKVDSAILAIEHISNTEFAKRGLEIRTFFTILKAGFAHKRKFLKSNLSEVKQPESVNSIWNKFGLNEKVRAEDVSLGQWFDIAHG